MPSKAETIMHEVNAAMGSNVLTLGSDPKFVVGYMSTGLLPFDILLGGGIPRGRFVTAIGDFSTLKSYIGLCAMAEEQKRGGAVALIDTEHSFEPTWATAIGVNTKQLITPNYADVQTGEQALDYAEGLIRAGVDLIVFDSVAAALPQTERNKRLYKESLQPARLAQLMSLATRKLTAANDHTGILWINQLRDQVGILFGNPERATGGRALPYYSSLIVNIRRTGKITKTVKVHDGTAWIDAKQMIGQKYKASLYTSNLSKPMTECHFVWDLKAGRINETAYLIAQGVELGFINNKGTMWTVGSQRFRGRESFEKALTTNHALTRALENKVRAVHELPARPAVAVARSIIKKKKVTK